MGSKVSTGVKIASVIIIVAGLMAVQTVILPILLALFLSVIVTKPIIWLRLKKVPHIVAILVVLMLITSLFIGMGALLGKSFSSFSSDIPVYEERFSKIMTSVLSWMDGLGYSITSQDIIDRIDAGKVLKFLTNSLTELGSVMQDSILILFISILMLLELDSFYQKGLFIRKRSGEDSLNSMRRIANSVRQYLWIKTLLSILTGVLVTVSLLIVGVDYAVLWGIVAFLLNYIPNIGSIIAAIPTMLFALIQLGFGGALWTGIIYLSINMVIGNIIEPKVTGKGLGLSTLVVFLSLLVWGFVFGTIGMFLSVPLTMMIKIILEENPKTLWIAVLLGTEQEAKDAIHKLE